MRSCDDFCDLLDFQSSALWLSEYLAFEALITNLNGCSALSRDQGGDKVFLVRILVWDSDSDFRIWIC